jgi:hypothetical protein
MTDSVLAKDLKPYSVYELLDPRDGQVFYIGKGLGARALQHELEAKNKSIETEKTKRIREIENTSMSVTA